MSWSGGWSGAGGGGGTTIINIYGETVAVLETEMDAELDAGELVAELDAADLVAELETELEAELE